jgi:hypothetical protein
MNTILCHAIDVLHVSAFNETKYSVVEKSTCRAQFHYSDDESIADTRDPIDNNSSE